MAADNPADQMIFPVGVKNLANLILDWGDDYQIDITPMKLQKLVYFCHADFLVQHDRPLVSQSFEAWEYGPVVPSLFHEFKRFGSRVIDGRAISFDPVSCQTECAKVPELGQFGEFVRRSFEVYSRYTASGLSNLSHSESGPWAEALRRFNRGSIHGRSIDNSLIAACHRHPGQQAVH